MTASAFPLESVAAPIGAYDGEDPLFQRALRIAAYLRREATAIRSGDVIWLMPSVEPGRPRVPMDPHLYSGSTGVAYFLAALDHLQGTQEHRDIVLRGMAPLRRKIGELADDPAHAAASRAPIGGLVGIGAWIYGLVRIGQWTGEAEMITDALRASVLITPERLAADDQLDVTRGAAGAVLALTALDAAGAGTAPDGRAPLDVARACAAYLLEMHAGHEGSPRAWWVNGEPPRNGFAHGASGIACALLRLHGRTGDAALRDAALEGFAYERHLWDAAERNWWDPHYDRFLQLQSWCFGAPGTLLARLEALRTADTPEVRADLDDTLRRTAEYPDEPVDHFCCGNFGRAEILATAAEVLDDSVLHETARDIAVRALARAETEDDFGFMPPGTAPLLRLSLFRGLAGMGYALVRLANPGRLPSPLAMQ
ncbi:MAG TPA: lanthionine synthetase LanC family protein [Longimicrobium sp.]|nr:lanthionine synthetase LanC family protein [Longimicrobium sp.]